MNKEKYLEELYQELQKYNADNVIKHVTEYDYLISDMLEESTFDEVITKLGTSSELAKSIADEFDYELKKSNQYEEPIISKKKDYNDRTNNTTISKVINILFIIASVLFFIFYFTSVFGLFAIIAMFGLLSFSTLFWLVLTLLAGSTLVFALYMLVLNLKNLLINHLNGYSKEVM